MQTLFKFKFTEPVCCNDLLALVAELFWEAIYRVSIGFIESLEAVLSFFLNSKLESPFAAMTTRLWWAELFWEACCRASVREFCIINKGCEDVFQIQFNKTRLLQRLEGFANSGTWYWVFNEAVKNYDP